MSKWTQVTVLAILLFALPACGSTATAESHPTPENPFLEEELAAQAIATARAEKTQIASRVSPYVKVSNGEQRYLAFWFTWNDETVFLPLTEFLATDSELVSCRLDSDTELATGRLFSGLKIVQDECVPDEQAIENALPTIKIPGYFDDGIDTEDLNVIDLQGEYAENFADVATLIIENDLLGSGDLTLSIYRTNGPDGVPYGDEDTAPTYSLPIETLQITFTNDQLENFEGADDVVYALERMFTWEIPAGYSDLDLSTGDENWFILTIREMKVGNNREEEYLSNVYIQIKGVAAP